MPRKSWLSTIARGRLIGKIEIVRHLELLVSPVEVQFFYSSDAGRL
jgi:hypothetical protein